MSKLTIAQKALRPVLNFLVERYFPNGAFFGNDYMRDLDSRPDLVEKWGSFEMACAMAITSRLRRAGAVHATFTASEVEDRGVPVGSWRMTVEKIEDTPAEND